MSAKVLTPEEQFEQTDFSDRDSIVKLFPQYVQEQYALSKNRAKNVSKAVNIEVFTLKTPFADQTLLQDTSLVIESGKRQCLYGPNSSGKTLLMTNITEGKIKDFPKHLHVHHCRELEPHELSLSVLDTVTTCNPYLNMLRKVEKKITDVLTNNAPSDPKKAEDMQGNLDYIKMALNTIRGADAEDRASKMLRVLGFDDFGQKKFVHELSGGLRMRVALCMAFFIDADLLLLDEPTNHLDFPSVLWLENRLRGYRGSFLLVSHDRELLNNVCTGVMLIEDKQIKYYNMGFKEFEKKKGLEDKKRNEEIDKFLEKNRNADPSTPIGRMKYDKKIWQDKYLAHQIAMQGKFTFPQATPLTQNGPDGKPLPADQISLINLQKVRFSYKVETGVFIFNDPIDFNVTASTRCGVMGPNGAGKSTLLKLLTGKLIPTEGSVTPHPSYKLAYFGQHSTAELNLEQTALEFMCDQFPEEKAGTLKNHLGKTGVSDTVANTRMERLSFSQRSCVIFAKLTFVCPHLLILDEPTNFLDLESVDSLIMACNKYPGALLLVSHNRDFLKKCAKTFLSVVPGQFLLFNDLKTAEQSTYSFIAEMEEGGKVGADALSKTPGGGSVHSSQKVGAAAEVEKPKKAADGSFSISASSRPATATVVKKVAPVTFEVNEKVSALWTDGKHYAAQIKKIDKDKYTVLYLQYGNTAVVPVTSLKKAPADAAKPAAGAAKPAPKK